MSVRNSLPDWLNRSFGHPSQPLHYATFGAIIARERKQRNLNQTEFAALVGISRGYVSLIEREQANNLSVAILLRLAQVLRVDVCELLKIYAVQPEMPATAIEA